MKRLLALTLALVGAVTVSAAEPAKPAIELRLKSVVDLLPLVEYGGELLGQANNAEQVAAVIKMFADQGKGLEGLDLKKPIGGYVIAAENPADSPIVLMVPVADEEAILGLLTDRANLKLKKEDDGTYSTDVPNFPASVHIRFAHGYAYVGIRSAAGIAKDKLILPKDFFTAKEDTVFAANVYPDRMPAELRTMAYGKLELQLNASIQATDPTEKAFQKFLVDRAADMAKSVLMDGEKLSLVLSANPKTDDIALELTLTPKSGTPLATTIGSWADRPSAAASFAKSVKGPAFAGALNFALPSETKAALAKLLDTAVENRLKTAKDGDKVALKLVFDALLPTAKSGQLELGGAASGPDSKGKFGVVAAVRTEGGKQIDSVARVLSVAVPADAAKIKYDIEKIGDGQLHAITAPTQPKEPSPFLTETIHVYTSDPLIAASLSADAGDLKRIVATTPGKTPMLLAEASVVKVFQMTKKVAADDLTRMTDAAFGKPVRDGDDVIRLTGTGGKELRIKLSAKGRALAFLRVVNE